MSALSVLYLILPLPLLFIFHDTEELFLQHKWMLSHKEALYSRFSSHKALIDQLERLNTQSFAVASVIEVLFILFATINVLAMGPLCLQIWAAVFLAFSIHLVTHVIEAVMLRSYVPGLVTSVLLVPYAIMGVISIYHALCILEMILCLVVGVALMIVILRLAQWVGLKITHS